MSSTAGTRQLEFVLPHPGNLDMAVYFIITCMPSKGETACITAVMLFFDSKLRYFCSLWVVCHLVSLLSEASFRQWLNIHKSLAGVWVGDPNL